MWPYRPERLSELLAADEIELLLRLGTPQRIQSNVVVFELSEDGSPRRIEASRALVTSWENEFTRFLRHGRVRGENAFEGADRQSREHEERFARRALAPRGARDLDVLEARDPLGLHDFAVRVEVDGHVVAAVMAGARVRSEEDRGKILKRVGKLGKLTQAEVRSIEAAGGEATPTIRPRDDKVREELAALVPQIPRAGADFVEGLSDLASFLATFARARLPAARRAHADALVETLLPEGALLPLGRKATFGWLERLVSNSQRRLGLEHVAVFARLPEELGADRSTPLRLVAEHGLAGASASKDGHDGAGSGRMVLHDADEAPALTLELARLAPGGDTVAERVENGLASVSGLIGALTETPRTPSGWKDRLTKSVFAAFASDSEGLEVVWLFGARTGTASGTSTASDAPTAPGASSPAAELGERDLAVLFRLARRAAERYLLAASESIRRRSRKKLERVEEEERLRLLRKKSPLKPQRFDARKLLDSSLESIASEASGRHITFDLRGVTDAAMIEADRKQIASVVDSLLRQAVERARPDTDGTRPSILVSLKRGRRDARRRAKSTDSPGEHIEFTLDVVGRLLSREERASLFRAPADGSRVAAGARRDTRRPRRGEGASGADSTITPSTSSTAPQPSAPAAAEASTDPGSAAPPVSPPPPRDPGGPLFDARRFVGWHRGDLRVDSNPLDLPDEDGEQRSGRTIWSLRLPTVVVLDAHSPTGASGRDSARDRSSARPPRGPRPRDRRPGGRR